MKEGDLVAGRYRLLYRIGAGAMGTVWAARHELLDRKVALKLASLEERGARPSREARELFVREVQIVGKLRHPNIVECEDAGIVDLRGPNPAGEASGGLYLAMELLEGESLAQRIARRPLAPADALGVAAGVCRGLAAAHAAGVVHRDVKPENVFLARAPSGGIVPKLLDFGVSSARGVATITPYRPFGTPAYMCPEQALGERVADPRADLWALGVVVYEMLTGRLPFAAPTYPALLPLIIEASYRPLPRDVPAEVRTVVAGCLAKDRSDRYPTADALLEAIERARAALPAHDLVTRSGFFVEVFRAAPERAADPRAAVPAPAAGARRARFGLATAILAVPVAIGIAALAHGARGTRAPSSAARPPSDPDAQVPGVMALDPTPCITVSAGEPLPAEAPSAAPAPAESAKPEGGPPRPPARRVPRIRWDPEAP